MLAVRVFYHDKCLTEPARSSSPAPIASASRDASYEYHGWSIARGLFDEKRVYRRRKRHRPT